MENKRFVGDLCFFSTFYSYLCTQIQIVVANDRFDLYPFIS